MLKIGMRVYHMQVAAQAETGTIKHVRKRAGQVLIKWDAGPCTSHHISVIRELAKKQPFDFNHLGPIWGV